MWPFLKNRDLNKYIAKMRWKNYTEKATSLPKAFHGEKKNHKMSDKEIKEVTHTDKIPCIHRLEEFKSSKVCSSQRDPKNSWNFYDILHGTSKRILNTLDLLISKYAMKLQVIKTAWYLFARHRHIDQQNRTETLQ